MSSDLKRFIISVSTSWCGMDQEYAAMAEDTWALEDIAEELAYNNFLDYGLWDEVAEDKGYDPSEMSADEWNEFQASVDESEYYNHTIDEFDGTEEEWNVLAKDGIYGPKGII